MPRSTIQERIEKLEEKIKALNELKNKKETVYVKHPEFENDHFFVEDGRICVKVWPFEPRRERKFNVDTQEYYTVTKSGLQIRLWSGKGREYDIDSIEKDFAEMIKFLREDKNDGI